MNTVVEPYEVGTVETLAVADNGPATIITTLYDLIAAIQAAVAPDDNALVVATAAHMLGASRVTWLGEETAFCSSESPPAEPYAATLYHCDNSLAMSWR